jgi:hypothetical protein
MIPLIVTIWSSFLGTLFEIVRYIKLNKKIEEAVGNDYPKIVEQSVQISNNLRTLYIGGLLGLSLSMVFLIASIFTSPLKEGYFSVILLMLCYLFLLIMSIFFMGTIYYTLISFSPFPRLSEIIRIISKTKMQQE